MTRYESAREIYASLGVDTEKAIEALRSTAVSVHCWQGDDVTGFDSKQALSGGIQTTGNYPGCEALGHHSETTTQIYLNSIKSSEVDDANAKILAAL